MDSLLTLTQAFVNSSRPAIKTAVLVLVLSVAFPKVLDTVDFRGAVASPLSVSVDEMSPAMVALKDVRENFHSTPDEWSRELLQKNWGLVTVQAGVDSREMRRSLEEMMQPLAHQLLPSIEAEHGFDSVELTGLKIVANHKIGSSPSEKSFETVLAGFEQVPVFSATGEVLPLALRKQQLLAAASPIEFESPSVADKAKVLIEQEMKMAQRDHIERVIQTQAGQQIYVARVANSRPQFAMPSAKVTEEEPTLLSSTNEGDHHQRPLLIKGRLQFGEGLAYTGEDLQISVTRMFEGEVAETGKVWIRDARYEIPVGKAQGYLIAEVHDHSGMLLAYHEYDLHQLPAPDSNQYQIDNVNIILVPVKQGAIVRVVSGYSYESRLIPVKDAIVTLEPFGSELKDDGDGQFVERTLENGSDIVVKVESKNHWPTLARVTSGAVATVRIFHDSMMKALIDIVSNEYEREENHKKGVIWGLVTENGRPVQGATVEINGSIGTMSYLNHIYLPDLALQQTSMNGMFAAIGAENGLQSIRVTYKGQIYPAQVVKTQSQQVSFLEIDFSTVHTLRLRVVDAFNDNQPVDASIRALGSETVIDGVRLAQNLKMQKSPLSYQLFEADAGLEYEMIRVEEPLSQHFIKFPLVQKVWLQSLKSQMKLSDQSDVGTVIGWVDEQGFDVILNDGATQSEQPVIFFDTRGRRVERGANAIGFIIFHVPVGQHTVTVLPESRKTVITKVLHVEPDFVSTISVF